MIFEEFQIVEYVLELLVCLYKKLLFYTLDSDYVYFSVYGNILLRYCSTFFDRKNRNCSTPQIEHFPDV